MRDTSASQVHTPWTPLNQLMESQLQVLQVLALYFQMVTSQQIMVSAQQDITVLVVLLSLRLVMQVPIKMK
jgi:hypothetical protein